MRKQLLLTVLFLGHLLAAQSLTPTENYIYSRSYLTPVTVETPTAKQVQSVTYYDGLGRPKQQIGIKANPTGKDLVTPVEYDGFGRQAKDWLPLPQSSTTNGSYYTQPSTSMAASLYGDNLLYAEKELENSPLDRVLQQAAPGSPWSLASGKTLKYGYEANASTDNVKRYVTTTTWSGNATVSVLKIFTTTSTEGTTFYPSSTLYKNKVSDEDGNISYEFKNGQGQTLLVRKMEGVTPIDTYYVYNEYDQLAFVLPPLASDATKSLISGATVSAATLDELCYQYRYDGKNRLVEKKLPGKGWEYMVYDHQDRLALTQDANMKLSNQWLFTKYDQFSRVVYTGITSGGTRVVEQNTLNGKTSNSESRATNAFTNSGMSVYYTNTAYPVAGTASQILTISYYDSYPADSAVKPAVIVSSSQPTLNPTATAYTVNGYTSSRSTKGLPTASYIKNIEDNGWTKNYTWYDTKGRAISTHSYNHLGGYTKTDNLLDFSGVPTYSYTYHKRLNADAQMTVRDRYLYDAQNRLTHHYHQVNAVAEELLAANTYSEVGQLVTKKVGTGTLQELNFTYNVRGWMTGVNNTANLGTDLFAYAIRYHNPQSNPYIVGKYNGNISQVDWISKNGTNPELRRYSYKYDGLNRLLNAYYAKPNAATPNTHAYNEYLTYDRNGNIKTLSRYGGLDGTAALKIDQLGYTYTGNRLITVADTSGNTLQGYSAGGNAITYDANGNMIKHQDKGISAIAYNYLNLPKTINQATGSTTYTYRADGLKVKKIYSTKTTDYLDGFQYETVGTVTALQFLPTSEGYYDITKNAYIYNYIDHLGNVRLSYRKNSAGVLEVLEENNYYPFGLKHEGYNSVSTATPSYKYKYNGKELQETGMYAMDFRHYMPDVGRFTGIDRLSEILPTLTPYRFAFNNPISFADPTGLFETRRAAREYRREHEITGSITRNKDGSYSINDKQNGVSYTRGTEGSQENFMGDGVQESVLLTAKAKSQTTETPNWYTPGGQANWFFAAGSTIAGIRGMQNSERMYGEGIRRGLNGNYQLTGRNLNLFRNAPMTKTTTPISQVGKWGGIASKASFGVGVTMDAVGVWNYTQNPNSPNAVHPAKAGLNTTMGAVGVWGGPPGAVVSAAYFGIDAFYPGGWEGALQDQGNLINANQEVVPNFNLYKDVPGGF